MKATIIDVKKYTVQRTVPGIRGGHPYENQPQFGGYYNGSGSWSSYPETQLLVVWRNIKGQVQSQDVRDHVILHSGRERLTQEYINKLKEVNVGKEVDVEWSDELQCRALSPISQFTVLE